MIFVKDYYLKLTDEDRFDGLPALPARLSPRHGHAS